MVTVSKLKKKLKGIGCAPIKKNKVLKDSYMDSQEFMASKIDSTSNIKAAFHAATLENDVHWGLSTGILAINENEILYTGRFVETKKYELITFPISELKKAALVANEDDTDFVGLYFEFENDEYSFLSLGKNLPILFVKEMLKQELERSKLNALLNRFLG